ncbi:MAG: ATP phosphoribosyltransferase regulatory subunit [Clostridiales bacterium]|nr:ATP phosphoribosyltransferase regulatory subunit [Clostridiales bacterium]
MINKRLHTPEGVKDFKPEEYAYKKGIEKVTETTFISNGYKRVNTPTLEFAEVFTEVGSDVGLERYKFLSREGDILVMRSDMTPAICRLAATAYSDEALPLRFYYIENMFRYNEKNQGKQREFTQGGIELIGEAGINGDCEVLICAVSSLLNLGLKDFKIDIGHAEFLEGALEEAGVSDSEAVKIKAAIIDKNYVKVSEIIERLDIKSEIKEFLCNLPLYLGGSEVLSKAKEIFKSNKALKALEYMRKICNCLKGCGLERYVCFDLGIVPQLEYYMGIIFRGYAIGSGYSILSGGRYDRLSLSFERSFSAVGFALKIDELIPLLEAKRVKVKKKKADTLLLYSSEGKNAALSAGIKLRKDGMNIENFYGEIDDGLKYAEERGFGGVIYFIDGESVKLYNVNEGEEVVVKISELLGAEDK